MSHLASIYSSLTRSDYPSLDFHCTIVRQTSIAVTSSENGKPYSVLITYPQISHCNPVCHKRAHITSVVLCYGDVRIPPQRQRTMNQTPTLIEKEQDKLSLQQKLHTITSLIPVLLAILEEQGVSVSYRVMGKNYKAADAFNRRLGLQKDNFTQGIHALAILLARSNASVSVCADDSSTSMPPSDSVILLAATAVCLPKSLPAFPGRQYITVTHSHGAEAIGGIVGQTFSPDRALLQIPKNPSDHIYRIR